MIDPSSENFSIAIFPYLKTSGPVTIGGIEFRSTDDTSELPSAISTSVQQLASMMFLQDDFRVASASYAVLPYVDLDEIGEALDPLQRVQSVIAYCYAAPHPTLGNTFLQAEHATCVVSVHAMVSLLQVQPQHHVTPKPAVVENVLDRVPGLRCLSNFKHHFSITSDSRIYPPVPNMWLNISQDLAADFGQSFPFSRSYRALLLLLHQPRNPIADRIFTAIKWFNLSNSIDSEQEAAIIQLSVAFEALLQLPEAERKTDRLADSVSLLLGRIPRLDEWVRQFYDARSEIAHEGKAHQLRFVAKEGKSRANGPLYHSLLNYGRQVFQLCLSAVLFGSELAQDTGLAEKLITNQQRFELLCKLFSNEAKSAKDRFDDSAESVYAIDRYTFVGESGLELDTMLGALQLAARTLLELEADDGDAFLSRLKSFVNVKRTPDQFDMLDELSRLSAMATSVWQAGVLPSPKHQVLTLVHVVWNYSFMYYFRLKKEREATSSPKP
ncbi:MAG: hypothetical protein ABSB50_20730 [Terracidiphilus sp.]|jgi:hypothetical protein